MAALSFDEKKKRWRVNFLDATGRRRRRFFQMKDNTRDFFRIAENREERIRNRLGWIEAIAYEDSLNLYRAEYLRLKSESHCEITYDRLFYLKSHFSGKPLCDVTSETINQIMRIRLDKGLSNKTVNEDRSALRGLFKWAMKRGFAAENPVDGVDALPKLPRTVRRAFTVEEISRLLFNACLCCFPTIAVLSNTGIRLGELDHLTTEDFDLERKVLFVTHSEKTPVKGKQSRIIPLNDTLIELISKLPEGKILKIPRSTFEKHFRRVRERAKVFDAIPHGLRHSYTSHLVESGLDLGRVQRMTGHQDIKTLQKYLHSTGSDLIPFRNAVQFAVPAGCPEVTSKRTKWGEMTCYGQNEKAENHIVMKSRLVTKVEAPGIEPGSEKGHSRCLQVYLPDCF